MKNILYITLILALLAACTGKKGDPGPIGDTGATGAAGSAGTNGTKGVVGDKGPLGPKGDTGATGQPGKTPGLTLTYTDWSPYIGWSAGTSNSTTTVNYTSGPETVLMLNQLLANPEKYSLTFFPDFGRFIVEDTDTDLPVGMIYYFNSINLPNTEKIVFNENYISDNFEISTSYLGWIDFVDDIVPTIEPKLNFAFKKAKYPDNVDFETVITGLSPKIRLVFIPLDLNTGGKVSFEKISYSELAKKYNIPKTGKLTHL